MVNRSWIVVSVCVLAVAWLLSNERLLSAQREAARDRSLTVVELQTNVYMLAGAGGNITVQFGPDGTVVVDSGSGERSSDVLEAIRALTDQPIRYVINTSASPEYVGGNAVIARAGVPFAASRNPFSGAPSAGVIGHENVLLNMSAPSGQESPYPAELWPSEGYIDTHDLYVNREGIEIIHVPNAHSNADSLVYFRRSDVVVAGAVLDTTRFPVIDLARGGTISGVIAAVNRLIDIAIPPIPLAWQSGGTAVVPGHGRVYSEADLVEYRDMLAIIRDVVRHMADNGLNLEQVQAASPTAGFNGPFGVDTGAWTTEMFVEAVYRSLPEEAR